MHTSQNKQRKFNLLRRLFKLNMTSRSSLINHERKFDELVEGLTAMRRVMKPENLMIIYANSLSASEYDTWLQDQTTILDKISLFIFKNIVGKEIKLIINLKTNK